MFVAVLMTVNDLPNIVQIFVCCCITQRFKAAIHKQYLMYNLTQKSQWERSIQCIIMYSENQITCSSKISSASDKKLNILTNKEGKQRVRRKLRGEVQTPPALCKTTVNPSTGSFLKTEMHRTLYTTCFNHELNVLSLLVLVLFPVQTENIFVNN